MNKNVIITIALVALILTGCGSEKKHKDETNYELTEESTSIVAETVTSTSEKEVTNSFSSINEQSEETEIYNRFVSDVESSIETYGTKENPYQSILLVLYKPDCKDCKKVEEFVSDKVLQAKRSANMIAKVENFNYTVDVVNIEKNIPDWVKNIYGLSDEQGNYAVPKFVVLTLKKDSSNQLVWDTYNQYTGTDKDSIAKVIDFYVDTNYIQFLENQPLNDPQYKLR